MRTLVPDYQIWVGDTPYFPRDALTYLTWQGTGDPLERNYVWVDDVTTLLRMPLKTRAGKGMAFLLENAGRGPTVLAELRRRFPNHTAVDLRYPVNGGKVFARGILVPSGSMGQEAAKVQPMPGVEREEVVPPAPGGKLRQPRGISVARDGNILVADFGNDRIQEFAPNLTFFRTFGSNGGLAGEFKQPSDVVAAADGTIYVADTWNHRVQVFNPDGTFVRELTSGFYGPRGLAVDQKGAVFVVDTGNNRVVRFSASGEKDREWGRKGNGPGEFLEPVGVAIDASGQVYVSDNGNGRLQVFSRDGKFVSEFKVAGWQSQVYSEPHLAIDDKGIIWVTVPGAHEVRAYDRSGKLLRTITGKSVPEATFETPMGIAFNAKGKELIVSDLENRLVRLPHPPQ
jgi:DNA-binding beta-propeller fold protein YncE